ncbi:MAG: hypothetical protein EXS08_09265 [Planctomycetes bacterium]|nr:hypothetical protein [Planctomycetota bacterium]
MAAFLSVFITILQAGQVGGTTWKAPSVVAEALRFPALLLGEGESAGGRAAGSSAAGPTPPLFGSIGKAFSPSTQ